MNYEIQNIVQELLEEQKNQYEYFLNLPESSLISPESPKKKKKILIPEYEIGGKKKNMGKKKEKTFPIIPIERINEFHELRDENDLLKKQIPKIQEQINKYIKRNQEGRTFLKEAEKSIKEMEAEKSKKEEMNRQKLIELENIRRKEQIEKNRSDASIQKIMKANIELQQRRDSQIELIDSLKKRIEKTKHDEAAFDIESSEKIKLITKLRDMYQAKIREKINLLNSMKKSKK